MTLIKILFLLEQFSQYVYISMKVVHTFLLHKFKANYVTNCLLGHTKTKMDLLIPGQGTSRLDQEMKRYLEEHKNHPVDKKPA